MASAAASGSTAPAPAAGRTLGFLLREVYGVLLDRTYAAVARSGHPAVRPAHSAVLRHLPRAGGRVADLARAAGLAKQSIAYLVEDLARSGYLQVGADPADGRAKRVVYTARGRRLLTALLRASAAVERDCARVIGKDQLGQFRTALVALREQLGAPPPRAR